MKLTKKHQIATIFLGAALAVFPSAAGAQDRGRDDRRGDDHHDNDRHDNDHTRHEGRAEYHFRPEDRGNFSSHYRRDIQQWEKHRDRRREIRAGEHLPSDYRSRLRSVPASYYRTLPPPPPGYRFGYYDGYVVAWIQLRKSLRTSWIW